MAKQSSSAEKSATKQPAKPPPTSTSMGGVTELAPEALGVFNAPSLHGQADRLGNTNLQAIQRQMLANRIGQTQGNGHLQQIVAFSRQQAPYQSNIVHRSPAVRHEAREQAQPTQESIADEQLAEIWGIESGLLATSANPTPKPTGTTVSVQRAAEAETLPTEAEKAAARAKSAAAEARAEQTSNQGRAQTDQARASQAAEQTTGQAAKQKASSARTAAAGKKAASAKEIAVNGAGHGGAQQAGPVEGVSDGTLNATNGNQAKAPASAAEDPGFQSVVGKVKGVADQEQTHAPAATKAKEAQAAAESPASELAGKAQSGQVEQMDAAETPVFNAAAFKQKLMARIEALTPKNAADADEFKEKNKAGALKGELQNETAAQKEQSQAPLAAAASQTPNTGNVEPKATTPLAGNPAGTTPALAGAEAAMPKPKGQGEVEAPMQAQSQQLDQQMADASVTEEQLAKSNEPEFQSAVTAKTESQAHAQTAPQAYRQDEQGVIQGAQAEATATVQGQTSAMHAERTGLMAQVDSQQVQGKSADEQKRAEVGAHIQTIYDKTKSTVEQILTSLDSEVDQLFNQGAEAAKQSFENYVEAKMDAYKEKRYGGMLGWAQWLADKIQPTQPEVFAIFAAGRDHYIAQMGAVIDNVVALIGRKLAEAKAEIASGKQEIQEYVSKLPADLQQVGQEAAQNIQSQFDELTQSVDAKQDELIDTLANKYNEKLQAVDARIEQLKAENETIYDKAANAIDGVIKTIQQLKQMMASILARAQSAIELIAADPIGFLGKLIDGVKLGLNNFMGNIGKHLETGFVTWLTGTVSKAGITLPDNWDLPGIFQLVMQLLGLGFDQLISRVSQLLGFDVMGFIEPIQQVIELYQAEGFTGLARMGLERLIGKEHMESLMHVWGIVQNVISGKWAALWGMLQEFLGNLKEMVFDQIIQYISEQVIKGGITWMLSLFNPVGAFIKACKAIYDIIMFFVNNGKQIMALVDAVINSVGAIATGNISAAATAIENALAKGIPVAIGFLASLLNLGDIGEKVQKIIQSVRGVVEKGLNAVFNSKPVQMVAGFIKKVVGKIKGGIAKGVNWAKGKMGLGEEKGNAEESLEKETPKSAAVKTKAHNLLEVQTRQPFETQEKLEQTVAEVLKELQPEGLKALNLQPRNDRPGAFNIIAEASPGSDVGDAIVSYELPPTQVTHTMSNDKAEKVIANPLTNIPGNTKGSPPGNTDILGWKHAQMLNKNKREWVRMHLLSEKLHGPGAAWNLFPGRASDNRAMELNAEKDAKNRITANEVLFYEIDVTYHNAEADFTDKAHFPSSVSITWGSLKKVGETYQPDSNSKSWRTNLQPPSSDIGIIPVSFNTDGRVNLERFAGCSRYLAERIVKERKKRGLFTSVGHFTSRMSARLGSDFEREWLNMEVALSEQNIKLVF